MSKRARITLHPDPEPAAMASPDAPATGKPSDTAAEAVIGPSAGRDGKDKASDSDKRVAESKSKARAEKEKEPARKPRGRTTPKPHTAEAESAGPVPASGNTQRRPANDVPHKWDDDLGVQSKTAKASQTPAAPRGMPDLGTMLKIAAPGLIAAAIAVAVVVWMKRKP